MGNRLDNVSNNMLWAGLYQMGTAISGVIIPAMLLGVYGANVHGLIALTASFMGYITIFNSGLTSASVQSMYGPLNRNNAIEINSTLNAIDTYYRRIGKFYLLAVCFISCLVTILVERQVPNYMSIGLILISGGTGALECFIYSKYKVLLQADEKLFIVTKIDILTLAIKVFLQIIMMYLQVDILFVQGIGFVLVILRTFLLQNVIKAKYRFLDTKISPDFSKLKQKNAAFIHQITVLVFNNTDIIFLTIFKNLTTVSIYTVYNVVISNITAFINNVFAISPMASFGQLIQDKDEEKLREKFSIFEYIYFIIISILFSVTLNMIIPFINLYTRNVVGIKYADFKLAVLFVAVGIIHSMRVPSSTIITAAGHFKQTQWRAILEVVLNLIISLCLVKRFGIMGVLIGTICAISYRTIDMLLYANKIILKRSIARSLKNVIRVVLILLINFIIFEFISKQIISTWIQWVMISIFLMLLMTIITLTLSFIGDKECAYQSLQIFKKVVNGIKNKKNKQN